MRTTVKYFLYLTTIVVFVIAWVSGQLMENAIRVLIFSLFGLSLAVALLFTILDRRDDAKKREKNECEEKTRNRMGPFVERERKSGLSWGGGNIKASQATRGTRRKFLGK